MQNYFVKINRIETLSIAKFDETNQKGIDEKNWRKHHLLICWLSIAQSTSVHVSLTTVTQEVYICNKVNKLTIGRSEMFSYVANVPIEKKYQYGTFSLVKKYHTQLGPFDHWYFFLVFAMAPPAMFSIFVLPLY